MSSPPTNPSQSERLEPEAHDDENGQSSLHVVGIGASAGGISALKTFFSNMPPDSGMAFVVCTHLSGEHESKLPEILQASTAMPVAQVTKTLEVEPNHIYVIPPRLHLALTDGVVTVVEPERIFGRRVPIDLLFRTLAEAYGDRSRAVLLSGGGSDGTLGLRRIKECGGIALAQDPQEADYDTMPCSAIASGLVDIVLPVAQIPAKLLEIREAAERVLLTPYHQPSGEAEAAQEKKPDPLREILTLLRVRTGHDFSDYKRPTLLRRIARRLHVHGHPDIESYLTTLRESPGEMQALLGDLLINVTNFFRDKEAFDSLATNVIPQIFKDKTGADTVRAWVCGCATGEEAYSIAILLDEAASRLPDPPRIQIFASDVSAPAIARARHSAFPATVLADVDRERAERYLTPEGDSFWIAKSLREKILFASHNVLHDPPFSRIDLVSCRNLLIYLNRETQERVMEIFSFALNPGGHLFLGASESAEHLPRLFSPVDKKHRLYKKVGSVSPRNPGILPTPGHWEPRLPAGGASSTPLQSNHAIAHWKLLENYAPPSVLANSELEVLHTSEGIGRFLRMGGGEPSRNLLRLIIPDLQLELRATIVAASSGTQARSRTVSATLAGCPASVRMTVRNEVTADLSQRLYLVLFETVEESEDRPVPTVEGEGAIQAVVEKLEGELEHTRDRLRLALEQGETSTEELRASNEEFQAINEELRSATEELETSKEELQSLNEELTTVNHELKEKIDEVSASNSDLQNLIRSTSIGILFLDRELLVKRFTPPLEQIFNIIPSDVNRPLSHLTHQLDYPDLIKDAAEVISSLQPLDHEIQVTDGRRTFLARLSPYRTVDDRIDGVVIAFLDITQIKRAAAALRGSERLLALAQQAANAGVWNLNLDDGSAWWPAECYSLYATRPRSFPMTVDNWIDQFHRDDADRVRQAVEAAGRNRSDLNHEYRHTLPDGSCRWLMEVGRAVEGRDGEPLQISGITIDVTERTQNREELGELLAERERAQTHLLELSDRKDEFLAMLAHELRNPLAAIRTSLSVLHHDDATKREIAHQVIARQVDQVVRLVDDLLDITRISQGRIRLQRAPLDLAEAVEQALESERHSLESRQLRLEVSTPAEPVTVLGDKARLIQCLVNLLNNAAKFTPPGGRVSIEVVPDYDHVHIRVADTGRGIEHGNLDRIFEMFTQIGTEQRPLQSGLGVGLGLVNKLIDLHDGTIGAQSDGLGHGSTFTITLPLNPSQKLSPAAASQDGGAPSPQRRILVVDDSVDAAEMLQFLLAEDGHAATVAHTGRDAIEKAVAENAQVVLLDIGLPDVDGYQVAATLRERLAGVILIALTGWGQPKDLEKAVAAGFDHHLLKPVEYGEIRKILSAVS
ncbi:hypothetical protein BH23VER1_BH23VER1_14780 [soil metagenome]